MFLHNVFLSGAYEDIVNLLFEFVPTLLSLIVGLRYILFLSIVTETVRCSFYGSIILFMSFSDKVNQEFIVSAGETK